MTDIELNINKYAQNKLTDTDIMDWFDQLDLSSQKEIRDKLMMFMQQSHPTDELISNAIQTAPIKGTLTPVILFKTQTFNIAISKIVNLPDSELRKSFIIMLSIFKTADTYRRETDCKNGCTHEWHNLK
ncbi:hypothetical protein BZG02_19900 [Labilibaculum filiforme]|uniref:Uncharacterized protein n=1 Tax=Labilibaculum filiforme TaxID=1940526 RepID=A0A2N3HQK1_9BACT|nr:DUF5958 family protein [Labilibaculum filiforme]PKQ60317.1 hypothetical protein BZG02_19900 [Labilibaculum filiforme]